ncbi:putative bifunctional diguanylate cyclase/phosphodiesterase [Alkalimarinus coralli]|uniref:putative bifunctional diguanylate cyclase/phosphodiesterase n=1 Tax=Alkalimarinus coralli TaxID=2935863 RepID=UPI00202AD63D|nr:GGDEF domain-containing response regulator [Alkalimarinus coralli]
MNILLVDDDQVDRALVIRTLKKSDLSTRISEAVTVDQGLDMYASDSYDLVLLDYRLPQRNGIEMIVELRNEPKENSTAIVMMSSSEDEALSLECIRAGAQDFLLKSEITEARLKRALLHASTRFELEKKLYQTYQKVKSLAETDSLTGLPNRYFFEESLKRAIVLSMRNKHKLALLLFDLDNFKLVNDTFGHDTGDVLLKKVVSRAKSCLRGNEIFARLGGDEFAILLSDLDTEEQAGQVARRIVSVLHKPFEIAATAIQTTLSVGIALNPENGCSSEELVKYADIAMYRAKKLGRNQVCFFEEEMQQKFYNRIKIEAELREAIDKNQFRLHYQPIVNPEDKSVKGFEALIRWQVENELRGPDQFIEIAEETQQIVSIGFWVIEEAISTLAKWNATSNGSLTMAINVSAHQLSDNGLVEFLTDCLDRYNVPAELIDIELTETALFKDTPETHNVMVGLSALNCRLSLDDFGTGFSSIAHLRNYPISVVKIDKSLMPENIDDSKNIALIEGLVSMASILGLDVVAEGVETEHQVLLCQQLNIRYVQGYYFSKPLPRQDIEKNFLMR